MHGAHSRALPVQDPADVRQAGVVARGEHLGAGVAVLTSMQSVAYYSGFLYCAFGRPYALVVTPDENVTISAGIDAGQPWRRT